MLKSEPSYSHYSNIQSKSSHWQTFKIKLVQKLVFWKMFHWIGEQNPWRLPVKQFILSKVTDLEYVTLVSYRPLVCSFYKIFFLNFWNSFFNSFCWLLLAKRLFCYPTDILLSTVLSKYSLNRHQKACFWRNLSKIIFNDVKDGPLRFFIFIYCDVSSLVHRVVSYWSYDNCYAHVVQFLMSYLFF